MSNTAEGIFIGILICTVFYLIGYYAIPYIEVQIAIIKNNRLFYKRVKEKDSATKKWIEVTGPDGKKLMVDENSGWCPSKNAFLPKKAVEALKTVDQMETDYINFKNSRMKSIAAFYGLPLETIEKIHIDVLLIKKDFYLGNINVFLDELKTNKE